MYGVLKRLDSSVHFDVHLLSAKGAAREHIFPVGIIMLGSMQCNLLSPCYGVDSPETLSLQYAVAWICLLPVLDIFAIVSEGDMKMMKVSMLESSIAGLVNNSSSAPTSAKR
jgi:hypothetical protein